MLCYRFSVLVDFSAIILFTNCINCHKLNALVHKDKMFLMCCFFRHRCIFALRLCTDEICMHTWTKQHTKISHELTHAKFYVQRNGGINKFNIIYCVCIFAMLFLFGNIFSGCLDFVVVDGGVMALSLTRLFSLCNSPLLYSHQLIMSLLLACLLQCKYFALFSRFICICSLCARTPNNNCNNHHRAIPTMIILIFVWFHDKCSIEICTKPNIFIESGENVTKSLRVEIGGFFSCVCSWRVESYMLKFNTHTRAALKSTKVHTAHTESIYTIANIQLWLK